MKPRRNLFLGSLLVVAFGAASSAFAATVYWDGVTSNWSDVANWSTVSGATTPNPAAVPTGGDTAIFNITTVDGNQTVYLNGNRGSTSSRIALQFDNTGTTQLLGGTSAAAANNILYTTSITVSAGAGAVTIGDTAGTTTRGVDIQTGTHNFTNNSDNLFTIANGIRSVGSSGTTTLTFTGTGNTSILGQVANGSSSNKVALTKTGIGTLTLSGGNTYTAATTISGGNLTVSSTGSINSANSTNVTGSINGGGTLDINGGTVNFNGANALLVGDNTTAGNVIVRSGSTLNLSNGNTVIGQGSTEGNSPISTFTQYGGATTFTSSILYLGNFRGATMDIQGGSLTSASAAFIGVRGNSTMTISGASTAVSFTQINLGHSSVTTSVTSDLNLNGGTLTLGVGGIVKAGANGTKTVSFDGGTLKASATSTDFVNADSVFVKTGGATIDTNAFDVTIDNALIQFEATAGALTKTGTGTLTLSAANTYTGTTTVSAGTLVIDGNISTSTTTVENTGTLGGSGTVGEVDVKTGGTFAPGNSAGTMTFTGDLTLGLNSISDFEINAFTIGSYDLALAQAAGTQTVNFNSGILNLLFLSGFNTAGSVKIFDFDAYAGNFGSVNVSGLASGYTATFDSTNGIVTVIPEPNATMLVGGLGLLALLRRRRTS